MTRVRSATNPVMLWVIRSCRNVTMLEKWWRGLPSSGDSERVCWMIRFSRVLFTFTTACALLNRGKGNTPEARQLATQIQSALDSLLQDVDAALQNLDELTDACDVVSSKTPMAKVRSVTDFAEDSMQAHPDRIPAAHNPHTGRLISGCNPLWPHSGHYGPTPTSNPLWPHSNF